MFEHKGDIPSRRFVVRVIHVYLIHQRISLEFQHGRHLEFRNFNMAAVTSYAHIFLNPKLCWMEITYTLTMNEQLQEQKMSLKSIKVFKPLESFYFLLRKKNVNQLFSAMIQH